MNVNLLSLSLRQQFLRFIQVSLQFLHLVSKRSILAFDAGVFQLELVEFCLCCLCTVQGGVLLDCQILDFLQVLRRR